MQIKTNNLNKNNQKSISSRICFFILIRHCCLNIFVHYAVVVKICEILLICFQIQKLHCEKQLSVIWEILSQKTAFCCALLKYLSAFHNHFVGDEGDKFTIGWLFIAAVNFQAEQIVDVFNFSSIPSHFNGMAHATLNF